MTNDLLPDRLKYFWADDEEGPYQGPFDSRDLAVSDAYCYRAKCFDDPSQTDGLFMIKTKGLLVDAVESPEYVLSIDVTDEFHDTWKTRADLVSTPNKSAEVDLDALKLEALAKPTVYKKGSVHEAEIFADRERTVEFTIRQLNDVFAAIEDIRNVMTLVPDSYRDYSPGLYKAIDDLLAASGHLATGKGGDRANERGDLVAKVEHLHSLFCYGIDHATQAQERQTIIDRLVDLCEKSHPFKREIITALKHTPQPSPQSDMVAVPRTILEALHQSSKLSLGTYDYQCGYLDAVKEAKSMLQPYTKGE